LIQKKKKTQKIRITGITTQHNEALPTMKMPIFPSCSGSSAPSKTATILGLGSLLSERSSRSTFPDLKNFRLGRVSGGYRRVYGHPAAIFFQRGIANLETKEMSSLGAEKLGFEPGWSDPEKCGENTDGGSYRGGFVCSVFEVPRDQVYLDEDDGNGGIISKPTGEFLKREEEFDIVEVPFVDYSDTTTGNNETEKIGTLCTRYTDEGVIERWGKDHFEENYAENGIETIWGWKLDSGLRPCRVYLRHCCLAAESMGAECYDSFLDETFLVDRTTTVRQYLEERPGLLDNALPPPELVGRYSG